ncbi:MAG: TlpA disulfide reductase family protein [Gemmataceae bacterium]
MKYLWRRLAALGTSVLLAAGTAPAQTVSASPATGGGQAPAVSKEDQEVQQLLARLTELSNSLSKDAQPAQIYRYQVAQTDVMLQLAVRSKGKERDDWVKMAVDSLYAAAVQAPDNDPSALQRLQQLPGQIRLSFPESKMATYAMLQEIQADYMRALGKDGGEPTKAQLLLRDRLLQFAEANPDVAEAPRAVMDAAQLSEQLNRKDDARKCYQYVARRYAGTVLGRKAEGVQWRLGEGKTQVNLRLPYIYATSARGDTPFDLNDVRGKLVVLYFWSTSSPTVDQDLQMLKAVTDRYQFQGVEVVYVNLDDDPVRVREVLSGKLLAGPQVCQRGGLNSETAQRFGITSLPEVLLVGKDGQLLRHSLKVNQVEEEISKQLKATR